MLPFFSGNGANPEKRQEHPKSTVFRLPWGKGTEGGEPETELGLQRARRRGGRADAQDAPRRPARSLCSCGRPRPPSEPVLAGTTCGSPGGEGGPPGGGGQFLPASSFYINKAGSRKKRRQRQGWESTSRSQPRRTLSSTTSLFGGNFGPDEIPAALFISPKRRQAGDS